MDNEEKIINYKIEEIIIESKKYNLIDRFYHFNIESKKLFKYINSLSTSVNEKHIYLSYPSLITNEIDDLIEKIKKCYGLWNPKFHLETHRILFLDNPNLLGISPFLFNQEDWKNIILSEIEKFKHTEKHVNPISWIINDCLNDTFDRLQIKEFSELQGIHHFYRGWDENIKTGYDLFHLIVDEFFDKGENTEVQIIKEKARKKFLENQMFNDSLQSKIKINYKFEVIDSIFKKYFEMSISKDKWASVYSNFNYYLKIIINEEQIEKKGIIVNISRSEIKDFIYFFGFLREQNILAFENLELFSLIQIITGLKQTSTWGNYLKPSKRELSNKIITAIKSIIP